MYDDPWFNAFVPSARAQPEQPSRHRRRETLLQPPNTEDLQADDAPVEGIAELLDPPMQNNGPPKATVARRAKSYSDFYDVVRAYVKKERDLEREKTKKKPKGTVETDLDFGQWYREVGDQLLDASHSQYQRYRDQLLLSQSHLDNLLANTNSTLGLLSTLSNSFKAVEAQTTTFQSQCEGLLDDQKRVTELAEDIGSNLRYYTYLEPITRRLNAPGAGNFVRGKEFSDMLANLDSCLEYMKGHPKHAESSLYRSRYKALLTRALTLIRVHFTNTLREIAADVSRRIADRQLNDTTMSTLLYAKFRVGAAELKQTGLEIQKRAVAPEGADPGEEAEYESLMNDLYSGYSATRGRLILPLVSKRMNEIALAPSSATDLVVFARSSISYVRGICLDEYDLWGEWFEGEGAMYDFLEAMCEPLYDHLRPRTIHESQILKLCELCTLIQSRYMEEDEDEEEEVEVDKLDFSALIRPALQDAQTRLAFLALSVLRDDIERYKPKPEDLEYPPRGQTQNHHNSKGQPVLSGRKSSRANGPTSMPKGPVALQEDNSTIRWNLGGEADQASWYPTLRKAVWLLSKIYRLVNSAVFDDLAHKIVSETTTSLISASKQLSTKASPTDSQLFLIRHLLILKQQIVAFDIEFVTPEVTFDFSSVTNTFWELRERGGLFNPRNLMRLVGGGLLPQIVENMFDAKAELDGQLRTVINQFTNGFATRMTAGISGAAIAKKSFDANNGTATVRQDVEKQVPFLRRKLDEYIDDVRTKETLVGAVQDQVIQIYEDFFDGHIAKAQGTGPNGKTAPARKKGKGREDELWDPDSFSDWCLGVFRVGNLAVPSEDMMSSRSESMSRSGDFQS